MKSGFDISDFFLGGGKAATLEGLMDRARRGEDDDTARAAHVADRLESLRVDREARALLSAEAWAPPPDFGSLASLLARPFEPLDWQISNLAFVGANVVIVAVEKSGKTVLVLNVARSLLSGEPLFDRFGVEPVPLGRSVAWWNAELTERQAVSWLRDMGIERAEDFHPAHLRDHDVPLTFPAAEDWAVEWLRSRNVDVWILDPKSALFHGEENSATETGEWLRTLDRIKRRAGVQTLYLVHHASADAESEDGDDRALRLIKGRGSTRLAGWADVLWGYSGRFDEARFLSARGRDVDLAPFGGINMDPATRILAWDGSNSTPAQDRKYERMLEAYDALTAADGPLKATELQARMGGQKPAVKREAIEYGVQHGYISRVPGPSNSTLHSHGEKNPRQLSLGGEQ